MKMNNSNKVPEECSKINLEQIKRRFFFARICYYLGSLSAFLVSIPILASLFSSFLKSTKNVWRKVGKIEDFKIGKTVLVSFENANSLPWGKKISQTASWLRRVDAKEFTAFTINCAHLGCPVRWEESAELFLCPCHGGVYYKDGKVAAGPPPKPLPQYEVRLNNGFVEIKTQALPITTLDTKT